MKDKMLKHNQDKSDNPIHPFSAPDGYFEDLRAKMLAEIKKEDLVVSSIKSEVSRFELFRPYLYLAAMFVGIFLLFKGVSYFDEGRQEISKEAVALNSASEGTDIVFVSEDDVEAFISYSMDDLSLRDEIFENEPNHDQHK
ncbi:hypothetical protein [Porphyromonas cangingivalis]|uniref:hypothetical protein n=1 Tax=Porphyromonas cangingivalis TaxID=36874 RepID=UPI0012E00A6F|nr:hypothetical protein [Porphyromonas cangingivalis]